jgi:pterin-4a-carbinolamine dehydratase
MEAWLQIGDERVLVPRAWLAWANSARSGWSWQGDTLVRELRFRDFDDGMRFLEQLGRRAEDHKRHPDISISSNLVRLTIANPHRAGITLAELRLAAKVNAVIDELGVGGDGHRPR